MDELIIAGQAFSSRLFTGTGKFGDLACMEQALLASGSQLATVALKGWTPAISPTTFWPASAIRSSACCPILPASVRQRKPCMPQNLPAKRSKLIG